MTQPAAQPAAEVQQRLRRMADLIAAAFGNK